MKNNLSDLSIRNVYIQSVKNVMCWFYSGSGTFNNLLLNPELLKKLLNNIIKLQFNPKLILLNNSEINKNNRMAYLGHIFRDIISTKSVRTTVRVTHTWWGARFFVMLNGDHFSKHTDEAIYIFSNFLSPLHLQ